MCDKRTCLLQKFLFPDEMSLSGGIGASIRTCMGKSSLFAWPVVFVFSKPELPGGLLRMLKILPPIARSASRSFAPSDGPISQR